MRRFPRKALWAVYVFMWLGGVIAGGLSREFPLMAPIFLLVAGVLAVHENRREWKPLIASALLGIAFELVGVHTGLPFGRYAYTSTLGFSVLGVPLVIGFAWLILIDFVRGTTGSVMAGALLMVAMDLVIDPLATGKLRFWQWLDHGPWFGVPTLNFVGWALASAAILAVLPRAHRRLPRVGWSMIGFFAVLAFEYRLWWPGAIGCALLALPLRTFPNRPEKAGL